MRKKLRPNINTNSPAPNQYDNSPRKNWSKGYILDREKKFFLRKIVDRQQARSPGPTSYSVREELAKSASSKRLNSPNVFFAKEKRFNVDGDDWKRSARVTDSPTPLDKNFMGSTAADGERISTSATLNAPALISAS